MERTYLITVKDKSKLTDIEKLGYVKHVAKLSNLITLEADETVEPDLRNIPNIVSVKKSATALLA